VDNSVDNDAKLNVGSMSSRHFFNCLKNGQMLKLDGCSVRCLIPAKNRTAKISREARKIQPLYAIASKCNFRACFFQLTKSSRCERKGEFAMFPNTAESKDQNVAEITGKRSDFDSFVTEAISNQFADDDERHEQWRRNLAEIRRRSNAGH
jgi:hypothetical protein